MLTKLYFTIPLFLYAVPFHGQKTIDTKKNPLASEIERLIKKSDEVSKSNLDSALYYSKKAEVLIQEIAENVEKIDFYSNLSSIYLAKGDFVQALDYALKASIINVRLITKDEKNQRLIENKYRLFILFGNIESQQNNFTGALGRYKKASHFLIKEKSLPPKVLASLRVKIYNNIGANYLKQKKFSEGRQYFKSAQKINDTLKNPRLAGPLLNNIGICYLEEKNYIVAIHYFEQSLELRKKNSDDRGVAQCYNNLGKAYSSLGNFSKAEEYFNDALQLGKQIGNTESILHSLEFLTEIHKRKDFKLAFFTLKQLKNLKDSLFNAETAKKVAQVELKYALQKQQQDYNVSLQKQENSRTKIKIFSTGIAVILLSLLAIAGLLLKLQKTKLKNAGLFNEKLELGKKNLFLEKEKLQEELEFQTREMTSKVMFILRKNELINSVAEQLTIIKQTAPENNQRQLQKLILELRQKKDQEGWKEFEIYFTKVHPDFYVKLSQLFPDLTPNEKKLCAFLRLNLSTKEISSITYQSINSIQVSRTRLRKKLNISGEDRNLNNFLMEV